MHKVRLRGLHPVSAGTLGAFVAAVSTARHLVFVHILNLSPLLCPMG